MDAEQENYDVVIIGAGISGLCAAYQLLKKDESLRVLILEAKDRIGGRTCCGQLNGANGVDDWDMGGQWVGQCQPHIMDLIKELDLETYDQHTEGKKVLQLNNNKISCYKGGIPALPWYAQIDLYLFISKVDRLIKDLDPEDPTIFPNANFWDSRTFEDVKKSMLWTSAARQLVDFAGRCIFGTEASQMSALYYLMYCAAAGSVKALISTEKNVGGQEMKVKGGAWQVCQHLEQKIGEERIVLKQAVVQITQDDYEVTVKTLEGITYKCQRVILALPPNQQAKIVYTPCLPLEKMDFIQRMAAGNITKVVITYKTSFWRDAGYSGEAVTSGGSSMIKGLDHGPLCIVFDGMTAKGSPALVGFIGGRQQIQYSSLRAEERKKAVLHNLSELFGEKALEPIDYKEKNWNEERYNHGGPVSVAIPGILTRIIPGLRKSFGRLHFAGTESATLWCGFMNGAVQSGYRAAIEVLYHLRPQVITASDLESMGHVKKSNKAQQKRRGTSLLYWSAMLAVAAGILYFGRQRMPRFLSS